MRKTPEFQPMRGDVGPLATYISCHVQGRPFIETYHRWTRSRGWASMVRIIGTDVRKSIPFASLPHARHVSSFPDFVNSTCVFPFMYGDTVYYNCISLHSDYDWCSLDKKFQGRWRYCTGQGEQRCDGLSWMPRVQEATDSS